MCADRSRGHLRWLGNPPPPSIAQTAARRRLRGSTLIELIVFIVIVAVAAAAVLGALQWSTRASPDPMIRRQMLSLAESMLEEVTRKPVTWCDPDDANARQAASGTDCASLAESHGPEPGETRDGPGARFDNVNDYDGFTMNGIRDPRGEPVAGLGAYGVTVRVQDATLADAAGVAAPALRITVSVSGPANARLEMEGYRTRHAPNAFD